MPRIQIKTELNGENLHLDFSSSEASLLQMVRASYPMIEAKIRDLIKEGTSKAPAGFLDESLVLLRCLVLDRLEPLNGKHIKITI